MKGEGSMAFHPSFFAFVPVFIIFRCYSHIDKLLPLVFCILIRICEVEAMFLVNPEGRSFPHTFYKFVFCLLVVDGRRIGHSADSVEITDGSCSLIIAHAVVDDKL